MNDCSESKHEVDAPAVDQLLRQVATLHEAVQARDDFIAIAAHELRNPMTPIMMVAELALNTARTLGDDCPPRLIMLLERMQLLSREFIQRSVKLLDVARIESGNLRMFSADIDLSFVVRQIAQTYEIIASRSHGLLEIDVENGITGFLDRLAVEQIVENLLSNALKFSNGKPILLRLRSDDKIARIQVMDQGAGMTSEQQERLFYRFEQLVAQHRSGGFGIGLWLANRLTMSMGGRIEVSSSIGQGSTFVVTLPLLPQDPIG